MFGGKDKVKVAIAQASPVFLDRDKTLAKARNLATKAASSGAQMLVFPEAWVSGFPYWIPTAVGSGDSSQWGKIIAMMQDSSLSVLGEETQILCDIARSNKLSLVVGCNELSEIPGSRTMYNTLLFISPEKGVLGGHRKLMPTYEGRLVWGMGDGSDLKVYDTDLGRLGGLICWENHMACASRDGNERRGIPRSRLAWDLGPSV